MRQSGLVAGAAGDQITALLDKEIGPLLEPVFVDAIDVSGDQLLDAEPHGEITHRRAVSGLTRR
jgi:hypothetical protein